MLADGLQLLVLRGAKNFLQLGRAFVVDGAELLHQPRLLSYFEERLAGMDARLKKNELVAKIQKRLPEIRPLISDATGDISHQAVEKIQFDGAHFRRDIAAMALR